MSLQIGIVGLPNVGKSTLFQALTRNQVAAENFPFCTIDPNVGCVPVPDERLAVLAPLVKTEKIVPTMIEFVDIAGLVAGAHKGEGLGNKFLQHIREVDAIAEVVRAFNDPDVVHVAGKADPKDDMETIHLELIMADLQLVEKLHATMEKKARGQDKEAVEELEILNKIKPVLDAGEFANTVALEEDEREIVEKYQLLTMKPFLFIANVDEGAIADALPEELKKKDPVAISAKIESELAQLTEDDAKELMKEMGMDKTGLEQLIKRGYETLNLITFLTAGEKEVRAWTVTKGSTAPQAAGKIHTDFEEGFIRAEVVSYDDFVTGGGWAGAREKGKVRMEGKEYVVEDGDVMLFHFS
ncbi:MAG: redox-regulated ATPase YchF [Candidatus Kerfeldbacteria bacterium]